MITRTWEKKPFSVHEICSMLSYELSALFHLALQWGSAHSDRSKASLREKVGFEGTSARGNCWCYITLASIKWLQNPRNMSRNPNMLDRLVSWAKAASSTVTVFFGGLPNHLLGERRGRYWTLWRAQIPALIKLIETWIQWLSRCACPRQHSSGLQYGLTCLDTFVWPFKFAWPDGRVLQVCPAMICVAWLRLSLRCQNCWKVAASLQSWYH